MKLSIYERSWHGIDFASLPVTVAQGRPADEAFYAAFYAALKEKPIDPEWVKSKKRLGDWIERNLLQRYKKPRMLAIATGLAAVEQQWLAQGYDVTLNDCSVESLQRVRARFPDAKLLIGSINELVIHGEYDVITVFAFDYALDDRQLESALTKLRGALAEGGMILNLTLNVLTWRRLLGESVKHLMGRYRRSGWIWWGWARSPAAIMRLAAGAGLRTAGQFIGFDGDYTPRRRIFWRWLPPRRQEIIMVLERVNT